MTPYIVSDSAELWVEGTGGHRPEHATSVSSEWPATLRRPRVDAVDPGQFPDQLLMKARRRDQYRHASLPILARPPPPVRSAATATTEYLRAPLRIVGTTPGRGGVRARQHTYGCRAEKSVAVAVDMEDCVG